MRDIYTLTPEQLLPLVKRVFPKIVDIERCLILYDCIIHFTEYKKNHDKPGVNISILYLRSILGGKRKTTIIIDAMKQLKVIKCKEVQRMLENGESYSLETYSSERKLAKTYFITDAFALTKDNGKVRKISAKLNIKALLNAKNRKLYNGKLTEPKLEHIYHNLDNVGIDVNAVEDYIKKYSANVTVNPWQYQQWNYSIMKIENQMIDVSRGSNGRLTTTLTNLKREFRNFLYDRVDGSFDFIEVDISNSQPLFVSIYLEEYYPEVLNMAEFHKWKELCQTGKIYDFLANELNFDRAFIKERFMDVLLFTAKNKSYLLQNKNWNNDNQNKRYFILKFIELFPSIWEMLLKIKDDIGNREFAKRIQRMESELMIDNVLVELNDIQTHFSIHDSIVCRTADVTYVTEQIRRAFKFIHGYSVHIKHKQLN